MKIIIAPDSFKGALRAPAVCAALREGWLSRRQKDELLLFPLADGGEGTCEALVRSTGGVFLELTARDPLMRPVRCVCGVSGDGGTGIMELASASGIELLKKEELDPFRATTYGSGEVLKHLLDRGCRRIVLGIGGSATVDGGAGMLQALGVRFYDRAGKELPPGAGGGDLERIARADMTGLDPRLAQTRIMVACDVTNPLCGPRGAAAVFAPQKGAAPGMIPALESALRAWAALWGGDPELPGGGAAGGVGFMLRNVLKAELCSGAKLVIESAGLPGALEGAALLITGEGCSDEQTVCGKLCAVAADFAAARGVPAVLCSGAVKGDYCILQKVFAAVFSISNGAITLEEAMKNTESNLRLAGADLAALAEIFGKGGDR